MVSRRVRACWRSARYWANRRKRSPYFEPARPRHGTQRSAEEVLEQFVLQRNDGLDRTRIALAGASAEQLPIDAGGIVEFGQNDVQPAGFHDLYFSAP